MTARRTYDDSCGIARALNLVGERWALLVVRELVHGPKRFTDLRAGLPGVSADVLAQRLRDLEQAGILVRRTLPPPLAARVYELTEWGGELRPALRALGRFGSRAPLAPVPPPLSVDAAVMALETMYREPQGEADGADCGPEGDVDRAAWRYGLVLDGQEFAVEAGGSELRVRRGAATDPVATLETDPVTLAAVAFHGRPMADALAAGELRCQGDRRAAERLLARFDAPVPVAATDGETTS